MSAAPALYSVTNPAHEAYATAEPKSVERTSTRPGYRKPPGGEAAASSTRVTTGYTRADRDYFRPDEAIPTESVEIIEACYQAYERFPLIRNVLDMMADFAVKGIDIVNRVPTAQAFAREWAARVQLTERSERLAHTLLVAAVAPFRRVVGRLPTDFRRPDVRVRARRPNPLGRGRIPIAYALLDPRDLVPPPYVDPAARDGLVGLYGYLPGGGRTDRRRGYPGAFGGGGVFGFGGGADTARPRPLDPATDTLLFYKRNDFDPLPRPLLFSLLRDLQVFEKLRMSDMAALDGAVQRLRVFTLGDLEHGVFPKEAAFTKLAGMLAQGVGGGTQDIIWGPDLKVTETQTDVHRFLGKEKYIPTVEALFQGLGVPPSLAGSDTRSGFTNNFVSLRTVVERLQYVRDVLTTFWEGELEILQDALGFRHPFRLVFDEPALADEATEKKLLIDLMDRGVISDESVLERFSSDPEIEAIRVRRESKERERGKRAPKASSFHLDASQKAQLERTFVQNGELTPSQVGLQYDPPAPGEEPAATRVPPAPAGDTGGLPPGKAGRPQGAKDGVPRKKKRVVPLKAEGRRRASDGFVRAHFLSKVGKTNARQLTAAEAAELEETAFAVLCGLPDGPVEEAAVAALLLAPPPVPDDVRAAYEAALAELGAASADDRRYLRGLAAAGLLDESD